jgi:hypothetical protein
VGLVGMIFVAKCVATWEDLDLGLILRKWLHKRFDLGGEQ